MYCGNLAAFLQQKFPDRFFWLNHLCHVCISFQAPKPAIEYRFGDSQLSVATGFMETGHRYFSLGARDATIFSNRASPRRGSQNGSSFNSP